LSTSQKPFDIMMIICATVERNEEKIRQITAISINEKYCILFFLISMMSSKIISTTARINAMRDVPERTVNIINWVESINFCIVPKIINIANPAEKKVENRTILCKNLVVSCFRLFLSIKVMYTPFIEYTGKFVVITGERK
jgi:hypothetical protein